MMTQEAIDRLRHEALTLIPESVEEEDRTKVIARLLCEIRDMCVTVDQCKLEVERLSNKMAELNDETKMSLFRKIKSLQMEIHNLRHPSLGRAM